MIRVKNHEASLTFYQEIMGTSPPQNSLLSHDF